MRISLVLAAGVLTVSLACGDGSPAPAPGPAGPDAGGNPTTATPPEPGTPSQPGTPAEPAPSPPAPQPEPDRFVDVERLDDDAECDALVPARIPAPVSVHVDGPDLSCGPGLSEGGGHVAVIVRKTGLDEEWQAFSPEGARERRFVAGPRSVAPQPDGWLVARSASPSAPYSMRVESLSGDGALRRTETPSPAFEVGWWTFAEDPLGGALVALGRYSFDPAIGCGDGVWRYDAAGAPRGGPAGICASAGAVSTLGEALLHEGRDNRVFLRWLRPDGTDARPPADAESPTIGAFGFFLAPLLDGSIAGRNYASWFRRYPHLAAAGEPAPPWLAARDGRTPYRFTRGNRGYAFFPYAGDASPDCRQIVDLLAPSGRLCVRLTFREDARDCSPRWIDQGWDGTVVQQSGRDPCAYRWWPGLLGGE